MNTFVWNRQIHELKWWDVTALQLNWYQTIIIILCFFRFINMKLKSVTFIDSTFRNCYFDDVKSVGSFFRNCTFIDAFFFNTGELLNIDREWYVLSFARQDNNKLLCDWLFLYSLARHRWIQVDRWHGVGQQHIHPQQDRMPDDVWWWLQCLLGLLHQLPGDPGGSARQHCVCPAHGQNWPSVHVR